jgi:hypothetical protein
MSKKEERELRLLSFLVMQELAVEFIFLPGVLKFEDCIIRPN